MDSDLDWDLRLGVACLRLYMYLSWDWTLCGSACRALLYVCIFFRFNAGTASRGLLGSVIVGCTSDMQGNMYHRVRV